LSYTSRVFKLASYLLYIQASLHIRDSFKSSSIPAVSSRLASYLLYLQASLDIRDSFKLSFTLAVSASRPSNQLCLQGLRRTHSCHQGFVTGLSSVYKICLWFGLSIACTVCPELGGTHGLQVIITRKHAGKVFSPGDGVLRGEGTAKSTSSTSCGKLEKSIVL
jgi:hypothetical protein